MLGGGSVWAGVVAVVLVATAAATAPAENDNSRWQMLEQRGGSGELRRGLADAATVDAPGGSGARETGQATGVVVRGRDSRRGAFPPTPETLLQTATELANSREAGTTTATAYTPTMTHVERLFGAHPDDPWHWRSVGRHVNFGVAVVVVAASIAMFVSVFTFLGNTLGNDWGVSGYFMWTTWFSLCLFVVLLGSEIYVATTALTLAGDHIVQSTSAAASQPSKFLQVASEAAALSGVTAQLREFEPDVSRDDEDADDDTSPNEYHVPRSDVFCARAYDSAVPAHNLYPPGSPVHAYNARRARALQSGISVELDAARAGLLSDGIAVVSAEAARAVGAISNACNAENGDVGRCCDEARAKSYTDLQQRCPGLALLRRGAANHCACLEAMTELGFGIEEGMIGLCASHMRKVASRAVENLFGVNMGTGADTNLIATTRGYGCTGVMDASVALVRGPFVLKAYEDEAGHVDRTRFDHLSKFIAWSPGVVKGSVRIEWSLQGCMAGTYTFQLRTANQDVPRHLRTYVDGLGRLELTVPAVAGQTWSDWTVSTVFQQELSAGDHTVVFYALDEGLPRVHQLAVCLRGDPVTGCPHFW